MTVPAFNTSSTRTIPADHVTDGSGSPLLTQAAADLRYLQLVNFVFAGLGATPTTLAGYGIVDALTQAAADIRYLKLSGGALTGLLDLSNVAAGQIKFPASANVSADAHTLDAYEEGTWTPLVTPSTSGTITLSAPNSVASYVRIGSVVQCWARLQASAISSPVGNAGISGFPFASAGVAATHYAGTITCDGMAAAAATDVQFQMNSGLATGSYFHFSAGTRLTGAADWTAASNVNIAISYPV